MGIHPLREPNHSATNAGFFRQMTRPSSTYTPIGSDAKYVKHDKVGSEKAL
jgi:hypothetical protein